MAANRVALMEGDQDRLIFVCDQCSRRFSTASGRGLHMKRAHAEAFNRAVRVPASRTRWCHEELLMLATEEIRTRNEGLVGNINSVLAALLPGRSVNAVRCARSRDDYHELYASLLIAHPVAPLHFNFDDLHEEVAIDTAPLMRALNRLSDSIPSHILGSLRDIINNAHNDVSVIDFLDPIVRSFSTVGPPPDLPVCSSKKSPNNARHRQSRRESYAKVQELWKVSPGAVCGAVLDNDPVPPFSASSFHDAWKGIVEMPSAPVPGNLPNVPVVVDPLSLVVPFTGELVAKASLGTSAPGPDGITWSAWRAVPLGVRTLILNICLVFGRVPLLWVRARTTMIPKSSNPDGPLDCRPISVAGVGMRVFHRILARRLECALDLHPCQYGFRPGIDGVAVGIDCLNSVIRAAYKSHRSLRVLSLDLKKAFDSVSHHAIVQALRSRRVPAAIVRYTEWLYSVGTLHIRSFGEWAAPLCPARGVRQGDPLSSVLFNTVFDVVLRGLNNSVGVTCNGVKISAIAYADDVVLFSSSLIGARSQLDLFVRGARSIGLEVNAGKSFALSLVAVGRGRNICVHSESFVVDGVPLPSGGIDFKWSYLGVPFSPRGAVVPDISLEAGLSRISASPLKPHQKLYVLNTGFLPRFYHPLILGKIKPALLESLDVEVRAWVRKVMRLPHDCPNAFLHSSFRDGGLGVPSLRILCPGVRSARLSRARAVWCPDDPQDDVAVDTRLQSSSGRRLFHATRLGETITGSFLAHCGAVGASSGFLLPYTTQLSGREYVSITRLRAGALPCRERLLRGRAAPAHARCCRGCGGSSETLYHIVQVCSVSHGGRVLRHDSLVGFLAKTFRIYGFNVLAEQNLNVGTRVYRPDLIVFSRRHLIILDVQIVRGSFDFDERHREKVAKYSSPAIRQAVASLVGLPTDLVRVSAVTLSWLGIWHRGSWGMLRSLGFQSFNFRWIAERVARGSLMNYTRWCTMVREGGLGI